MAGLTNWRLSRAEDWASIVKERGPKTLVHHLNLYVTPFLSPDESAKLQATLSAVDP